MIRLHERLIVIFSFAGLLFSCPLQAQTSGSDSGPAKKKSTELKGREAQRDQELEPESGSPAHRSKASPSKTDAPLTTERRPPRTDRGRPLDLGTPAAKPSAAVDDGPSAVIREPSQGRPIFITPGETFYFVMRLTPEVKGDVGFALVHIDEPGVRVPLKPTTPPSYVNDEYCSLILQVPGDTEPGLYDIQVKAEGATYNSPHSVKVVDAFKSKFRFVHLSNMNVGDLTAPNFDEMLPKEINLLAPEFIVATGDYTEWARARDDATSWPKVLKFFEQFNAPIFMLCGAHDHEASFTRFVASKPIGTIDYGNYHGLLLLDHPGNPIDQDSSQVQWVEADLKRNRNKRFNFIATNSDELGLLDVWREAGNIKDFIHDNKVKLFLTGGATDWDFKEFADKLEGLDGLHFVRTHESSTSLRDRATGFSHYRVIDVDGDKLAYTYPNDNGTENLQHSIPTGRLRAFYDGPNDGSVHTVTVTVQNALNQSFDDAHVWLRVAKGPGGEKPTVAPGRLVQALDAMTHWACDVAFDLPDKGAVRIVAAADPEDVAPALPIEVALDGPREWNFAPATTDFGLTYFTSNAGASLKFTNNSKSHITCWPVICVNGGQINPDPKVCPKLPLSLEPGKTLSVPLVLNLRRVSPGKHALQVHFLEDPLSRLSTFEVTLAHRQEASASAGRDESSN